MRRLWPLFIVLLLSSCAGGPIVSSFQYVRKAASGMMDSDHDGTQEEFVIGVFTVAQERSFVDKNNNEELDVTEAYKDSAISLAFDHNTNWRGFIEFTAAGDGWTFNGELDLSVPNSGVVSFGVISTAINSIKPGATITVTRIINYPTAPG